MSEPAGKWYEKVEKHLYPEEAAFIEKSYPGLHITEDVAMIVMCAFKAGRDFEAKGEWR